jgi:hypothetical protein
MRFYRFYEKVAKVKADVPAILNSCLPLRPPQIDADHREAVHGWGQSGGWRHTQRAGQIRLFPAPEDWPILVFSLRLFWSWFPRHLL